MLAVIFFGRQCWAVCHRSRADKPDFYADSEHCTELTAVVIVNSWTTVAKNPIVGRRLSSHGFIIIDFSCVNFYMSKHVSDSSKSRFFAKILSFFLIFFVGLLNKIWRNDKYFLFFSIFFADVCRASMSAVIVGRQNDSRRWRPTNSTMLARVLRVCLSICLYDTCWHFVQVAKHNHLTFSPGVATPF